MKHLYLFSLILVAEVCFSQLVITADTTICAGQSVQLNASGGTTYTWTPAAGLSSTTVANPVATPSATTAYVVSSPMSNANIALNPTFALGNTGFTSSYVYEVPTNILGPGSYYVGGNANHWNTGMSVFCNDRGTDADTNMLVANSATVANTPVWCQTHVVYPNCTYSLSGYFQTLNQTNFPSMRWMVNGTLIGSTVNAVQISCIWTNFTATWNSGTNTSATFCIVNPVLSANGNDFGLDEISIVGSGTMYDTVTITVADPPLVNLGGDTAICSAQSVELDAENSGSSYLWSDNSVGQTLSVNAPGTYSVTVTNADNCSASDAVTVSTFTLSLTASSVNTSCGLNNGSALVVPNNGNSPYTFLWSNSAATSGISNLDKGTYSVTVQDAGGCSATATAVVDSSALASVNVTASQTLFCANDSAELCATPGFISYLWNTGQTGSCINTNAAGNYYVTVTVGNNCTAASSPLAIAVYPVPAVSVTVNGDTLRAFGAESYQWYLNSAPIQGADADTYIATQTGNYAVAVTDTNGCVAFSTIIPVVTGLQDAEGDMFSVSVYPNPSADGVFVMQCSEELLGQPFDIVDVTGRVVMQSRISAPATTIELNGAPGVYVLRVQTGKGAYLHRLVRL